MKTEKRNIGGVTMDVVGHCTPWEDMSALVAITMAAKERTKADYLTMVEIGSWVGESAGIMLSTAPDFSTMWCIDPHTGNYGDWLGDVAKEVGQKMLGELLRSNLEKICDGNGKHFIHLSTTSEEAAKTLEEINADLIFIDAEHDAASVYRDIVSWIKHAKPNGIIAGHDMCYQFPGVEKAVATFCDIEGIQYANIPETSVWWFIAKDKWRHLEAQERGWQQAPSLVSGRPETGPMRFGDDWPGVFIRGDNAMMYAMTLRMMQEKDELDAFDRVHLANLISDLTECRV
jgi:hypothetical protein